jgi:hypothetical protein
MVLKVPCTVYDVLEVREHCIVRYIGNGKEFSDPGSRNGK